MLKISLLGEPRVKVNDQDITKLISSKGIGILAYLISKRRGTKILRNRVSTLFWSDSSEKSAKYNLRYTLWALKKTLRDYKIEEDIILCHDKHYCLIHEEANLECDLENFEKVTEEILKGNWNNAENFINIYKGEFLQGFQIENNQELDDWIIFQRERLQRIYFRGLRKLAEVFSNLGQYGKGIEYLQQILYANPLEEDIYRQLMELYYLAGDRVNAMKQYEKCSNILRNELNISPMEETTRLYQNIKTGQLNMPQKIGLSDGYIYPQFFILGEIIEQVMLKYPEILKNMHPAYKIEIAKLLPEIIVEAHAINYLSADIEKLRIFRAGGEILKECMEIGELPKIKIDGEIDQTSKEFLQYIEKKFPEIWINLTLD